ncbi:potassium channel family protein [Streptomonospora wellingtoniae]|uniref:Potassium channel family protein n=1 Tax=Streptomonospora wellingtoniae TaxID=3075544 RepID=A0ABU2KMM7_9ACTN|nr:potassium channel family protein [Streptomonospora sp. DSM 45055]MDT0300507.1 potassium channel family protein [Streptomonospora sp. DSM 45055]
MVKDVLVTAIADVALIAVYALAPLTPSVDRHLMLRSIGALLLFAVLVVWQVHAVSRAPRPELRAGAALGLLAAVYLLGWAAVYVLHSAADPAAFTERLNRIDALYFAVTVFATVGFGDIVPLTQTARALVTSQMLLNLLLIGAVLRLVMETARQRRRRLDRG